MSEIPKDISDIAKRLSARAISMNLSPIDTVEWVVQQAIVEERERCARIVSSFSDAEYSTANVVEWLTDDIAKAIRKGDAE